MYQEHPAFSPPPEDAVLWRYLDIAKFFAALERNSLYFARANTLGDPFEGSYGAPNVQLRPVLYPDWPEPARQNLAAAFQLMPHIMYVNCWHRNDSESEAMWGLYATRDRGIAIRTTFGSLRDSIVSEQAVHVGEVTYIDHSTTLVPEGQMFTPFLLKRQSFAHEREVRAVTMHIAGDNGSEGIDPAIQPSGINCAVDLTRLIEEIIVTPLAQDWLVQVVQGVASRYGLMAPIRRSAIASQPHW